MGVSLRISEENPHMREPRVGLRLLVAGGCLLASIASAQAQDSAVSLFPLVPQSPISESAALPAASVIMTSPSTSTATSPPSAPSESKADLEARILQLEATVRQMQGQKSPDVTVPGASYQLPDAPPPAPDTTVVTEPSSFNPIGSEGGPSALDFEQPFKGFFLESPDKAFSLRFTGQIQLDYRDFVRTKDRTDIDTFLLRRARFGLEATLAKYYEFRFLPDFGQGTTIVQDAYMNVHYWDAMQFEFGRFKQPISYEQLIQDRYVPTLERSLIDQLVPARDLGAMIHGEDVFQNRLDYAVSVSNGEINGNSVDLNNSKDVDGRIAVRPLNDPDLPEWMRYFQVGVSGGFGVEQEPINPATLKMPDTVPFLSFNSTVRADGVRTRLCPELAYFYGPLGFLAQYYAEQQDMEPNSTGAASKITIDVPFSGYMLLGTLFLTGETRTTWSEQVKPLRPFNPHCPITCPGAWELVGRVSRLTVDDVFEKGNYQLVNPAKNSNEAMEFTIGCNWYLNAWVRMQFNYEHDMFGQPVLLGSTIPTNQLQSQDSLFTRFQVIF
jgi:phosphate-selective porin OprO and OprP